MNVFDLPGPSFLLFYIVLAALAVGAVHVARHALESGPLPRLGEVDPYLIAYLRGGAKEALRVAALSLLDRKLLTADGEILVARNGAVKRVRRPIEREILEAFERRAEASSLFLDRRARATCDALASELQARGLLPSRKQWLARLTLGLGAVATLWWVAYHKIELALSRGRHNISFLIILALAVAFAVTMVLRSPRTVIGQRVLQDLQTLFARLRERAIDIRFGGDTNELALLIGIFGLGVLYGATLAQAQTLFPAQTAPGGLWSDSASSGDSGGSSCGSSSGSGGSSCGGGGGCGGGCGGCGG